LILRKPKIKRLTLIWEKQMNEKERKTILVVEDDPDVLSVMVKNLELAGYKVITATDGMEGLKKIKSGGYNLVITDIVMPYVSGTGVVSVLKESEPHIPVIAVTGYGEIPETVAMERKADLVLSKPVRMSDLKEHVARLLEVSEMESKP
jgi:DNA-binding NtrC family response regulator